MESEFRPIPPENNSDTPESLQECFDLKEAIDSHANLWYQQSVSYHPGTRSRFSIIINSDCQPLPESIDNIVVAARFQKHLSKDDEYNLREQLKHQELVSVPANDTSLDIIDIDNPRAAQSFALLKDIRDYPNSNAAFVEAYDHLYRLYVKREQLAKQIGKKDSFNTSNMFSQILIRVFEDRHLGAR